MIAPEKVAELASDYRASHSKDKNSLSFVCAAEALADAGLDMADLIAKQAAEIEAYRRGAAHSANVFADLKADFDMQAAEIGRLKGDMTIEQHNASVIKAHEAEKPSESTMLNVLADIRMITGLREKPMLLELAGEIGRLSAANKTGLAKDPTNRGSRHI
jgi:hypothetical protein